MPNQQFDFATFYSERVRVQPPRVPRPELRELPQPVRVPESAVSWALGPMRVTP